ncbi:MAG TPA: hypothetical protein VK849_04830, partial [Longimicrobiales bacterium]|nr:hypothetical protein [Longimicrobiales bacterium]
WAARPVVPLRPLPAGGAPSLAAASRAAPAASAPIAGPGARTVPRGGEAAIRLAERALIGELGGLERMRTLVRDARAAEGPRPAAAAVPAVGDTLTLYADYACTERPSVRAVTRHVGTKSVWLDDVENPGPEFTTSELQSLDDVFATYIDATLTDYYGSDADVDANGRVLVLMTKTVNEMENVAGFVWSGDLFPTSVCANSNVAEIFYGFVPDPTGIFGEVLSKSDVLATYPRLIAHEVTHVRQFTRIVFGGAGARTSWELEGGATLAEQLVGYRVMGDGSGLDLGFTELEAGGAWYRSWARDLGYYQGYVSEAARTAGAPEQCTWIGRPEEGNDGPCVEPQRAVYGVPATLLRFVLDRWGPAYPGGELAMMLRMTAASTSGYATLTDVTGEPVEQILSEFGPILWMDGRGFDSFASWNLWDIFSNLPATSRLEPYLSTLAEPGMSPLVRDGSTAFLRWLPVTAHAPTSLRLRTPSDAPLPEHMILWVVRLR